MVIGGGECRKSGAFGTALKQRALHRSWCKNCETPLLTRHVGISLCDRCRAYVNRTSKKRVKLREALTLYWVTVGLLG